MSITFFIPNNAESEYTDLNITNSNFKSFMTALGYNFDENHDEEFGISFDSGKISPYDLLSRMDQFIPEMAIRIETQISKNHISCGLALDQINRYVSKLKEMCEIAIKSEKFIYWS